MSVYVLTPTRILVTMSLRYSKSSSMRIDLHNRFIKLSTKAFVELQLDTVTGCDKYCNVISETTCPHARRCCFRNAGLVVCTVRRCFSNSACRSSKNPIKQYTSVVRCVKSALQTCCPKSNKDGHAVVLIRCQRITVSKLTSGCLLHIICIKIKLKNGVEKCCCKNVLKAKKN